MNWSLRLPIIFAILVALPTFALNAMAEPTPVPAANTEAYEVLGIPPNQAATITSEQIEQVFDAAIQKPGLSDEEKARMLAANTILSNDELRGQYNSGRALEITVPDQERAELAEMMKVTSPASVSKLMTTGKVTVEEVSGALNFYAVIGVTKAAQCFDKNDADVCKSFISTLSSGKGYLGFTSFIVASKLVGALGGKIPVRGMKTLAPLGGMVVGSFVNGALDEVLNSPEWKIYWNSFSEKDSVQASTERDLAAKTLFEKKMFGNSEWWKQKTPEISSMVMAAAASHVTMMLAVKVPGLIYNKFVRENPSSCFARGLKTYLQFMTDPQPGRVKKQLLNALNLGSFLIYSNLMKPGTEATWNRLSLNPSVIQGQANLQNIVTQYLSTPDSDEAGKDRLLKEALRAAEWETEDYDKYRLKKLSETGQTMSSHASEFEHYHNNIDKISEYYTWFTKGAFDQKGFTDLVNSFYGDDPNNPQIQKDVPRYLHSFFCGGPVEGAIHDAKDHHGLPSISAYNLSVTDFRVVPEIDPQVCALSPDKLEEKLAQDPHSFDDMRIETLKKYDLLKLPIHRKMMDKYEDLVDKDIVKAMDSPGVDRSGLPNGIMATYKEEARHLQELKDKAQGTPLADELDKKIKNVRDQAAAAQKVLTYFATPPDDRKLPAKKTEDLTQQTNILDLINGTHDETKAMVDFYSRFILQ